MQFTTPPSCPLYSPFFTSLLSSFAFFSHLQPPSHCLLPSLHILSPSLWAESKNLFLKLVCGLAFCLETNPGTAPPVNHLHTSTATSSATVLKRLHCPLLFITTLNPDYKHRHLHDAEFLLVKVKKKKREKKQLICSLNDGEGNAGI